MSDIKIEKEPEQEVDIDFPTYDSTAVLKPRVHDFSSSSCLGCEG